MPCARFLRVVHLTSPHLLRPSAFALSCFVSSSVADSTDGQKQRLLGAAEADGQPISCSQISRASQDYPSIMSVHPFISTASPRSWRLATAGHHGSGTSHLVRSSTIHITIATGSSTATQRGQAEGCQEVRWGTNLGHLRLGPFLGCPCLGRETKAASKAEAIQKTASIAQAWVESSSKYAALDVVRPCRCCNIFSTHALAYVRQG